MIAEEEREVYELLDQLNIPYKRYTHKAVFTVDQANSLSIEIPGRHCKNIFISDRKKEYYFLVLIDDSKKVDFKSLSTQISYKGLHLASEDMLKSYLGLEPGSVTPFGLIHDKEKKVQLIIDKALVCDDVIGFHPNVNTATITVLYSDFKRFLEWCGNKRYYIDL